MKYVLDMCKEINSKEFLTNTKFIEIDHQIKDIIYQLFREQIKSKNEELVQHLRQIIDEELKSEHLKFYTENEKRREDTAHKTINMCINLHKEMIEIFFKDKIFEKAVDFDKVLAEAKTQATNKFNEVFNEENADSNAQYLFKVKHRVFINFNSKFMIFLMFNRFSKRLVKMRFYSKQRIKKDIQNQKCIIKK